MKETKSLRNCILTQGCTSLRLPLRAPDSESASVQILLDTQL